MLKPLEPRNVFDSLSGGESFVYLKKQSLSESNMRSKALLALSIVIAFTWLARFAYSLFIPGIYTKGQIEFYVFAFLFFLALGFAAYRIIQVRRENSAYGISDKGIHYRYGLLNGREKILPFQEVRLIKKNWKDLHATRKGYGKITIILNNEAKVVLNAVDDPSRFYDLVRETLISIIPS